MQQLIQTARLIDGTGAAPKDHWSILVRDGVITDIGPQTQFTGIDAEVLALTDGVVVPGFLDVHTHFCYINDAGFQQSSTQPNKVAMLAAGFENARTWLHQGVTTTRLVGTPFDMDLELRRVLKNQPDAGPQMVCAGHMMTMVGGRRTPYDFMKEEINGADEARQFARRHFATGADLVKLYCTTLLEANVADYLARTLALPDDAPDTGRWGSLTEAEIAAVCEEAHGVGRTVAAHVAPAFGIKIALRGGVDTIEHGTHMDDECLSLFLDTGATLVPTLSISHYQIQNGDTLGFPPVFKQFSQRSWEKSITMFRKAYEAGVRIATGTDAIISGMDYYSEVELLVTAVEMPPMEAIVAATKNGAAALGMAGERVGTLEKGKYADLLLLADDPLTDIHNIRKIDTVLRRGAVVARPMQTPELAKRGHHD